MRQKIESPSLVPHALTRRQWLESAFCLTAAAGLAWVAPEISFAQGRKFRAAVIGDTGHGNYGHEHDLIFNRRQNIEIVAVADPDETGRAKAAARIGAARQYADYRQMLSREKPDLVSIAPRWTDQHHAMAMAALHAGAHVYLEKPITQTLQEADELLALAKASGLKTVVAHQMRLAPNILLLKQALEQRQIGDLLEIRAHGKQDQRAGGEDLIVLGVHLFDLMRFFAGDPLWCTARVLQKGHDLTTQDAHPASEKIGPVAGDEIWAQFAFPNGVSATFTSRPKNRESAGPWGMELICTKGTLRIHAAILPQVYALKRSDWTAKGQRTEWELWDKDPTLNLPESERSVTQANHRVVEDWLEAIATNREPACSGYAAMKALEMAMAVFEAGLSRKRAGFPLANRRHPLAA